MVAGQHVMGRWHATGQGASDGVAWHAKVQVVRVVVVGSDRAGDLSNSMWVGDAWVRGTWVRERVRLGMGGGQRWATSHVTAWWLCHG